MQSSEQCDQKYSRPTAPDYPTPAFLVARREQTLGDESAHEELSASNRQQYATASSPAWWVFGCLHPLDAGKGDRTTSPVCSCPRVRCLPAHHTIVGAFHCGARVERLG